MYLNSSGNVGIGTTGPGYQLDVKPISAVGAAVFTGAGLNDGTFGGTYLGSTTASTFTVIVDGVNGIKILP